MSGGVLESTNPSQAPGERERAWAGPRQRERDNRSPLPLLVWVDQSPATFLLDMKTENPSASSYKETERSPGWRRENLPTIGKDWQ